MSNKRKRVSVGFLEYTTKENSATLQILAKRFLVPVMYNPLSMKAGSKVDITNILPRPVNL